MSTNNVRFLMPYRKDNPIVYDNDAHADVFTDELLIALSASGEIDLRGFITSSPANGCVNRETYELDAVGRIEIINKARKCGLRNVPEHFMGPAQALVRPESGEIDHTVQINTPGSWLIVEEARKASREKPLVVIMGGPLTVVADAYLLDNTIANNIVVAWLGGSKNDMKDYNGGVDSWAAYIVLSRLKLVQFPAGYAAPVVPKAWLKKLPPCDFTQWMIDKRLPHVNPLERIAEDGDGQPIIPMLRPEYILKAKKVSFSHWIKVGQEGESPAFKDDPEGSTWLVSLADAEIATEAWWEAMNNPKVWETVNAEEYRRQRPFYAAPFPIGRISRVEAEDFDLGDNGIAYYKIIKSKRKEEYQYRNSDVEIIRAEDVPGGYNLGANDGFAVSEMAAGEWLKYTLNIEKSGFYDIELRIASDGRGGTMHVEFDGNDKTGAIEIPDTGGSRKWQSVCKESIYLNAGLQEMKLVMDENGDRGFVGNINYICLHMRRA
jgi:hypothetical protein